MSKSRDVLNLAHDLELWIAKAKPVMQGISNKIYPETPLEISVKAAAERAWQLRDSVYAVASELNKSTGKESEVTKFFIDTEFDFSAEYCGVTPISIAILPEHGIPAYYAVSNLGSGKYFSPYVREHVVPKLFEFGDVDPDFSMMPCATDREDIAREIRQFIGDRTPEFWGDYADFDYVVLATLMGGFDNWPKGWPMFINDLQQLGVESGPSAVPHNAFADAHAVRDAYRAWEAEQS